MNTPERVIKVDVEGLPDGYEVTHHEARGYDSPGRWYEVSFRGTKVGLSRTLGYGSVEAATKAAVAHSLQGPKRESGASPYEMLERIFGRLPKGGCLIQVEPPEPSGRIPFRVYDPAREEEDGTYRVHRDGVSPAILEDED